jgi:large subunit ribosomal protein L36e
VSVIRRVISELVGRSPYEKKIMEVLKLRQANSNKKAYKLAKKRLGSHKRAIKKREELVEVINTRK